MQEMGKVFLIVGGLIMAVGLLFVLGGRIPWLGRLPGDIRIQRDGFSCLFPLATSIVLSLLLTIALNIILRLLNK